MTHVYWGVLKYFLTQIGGTYTKPVITPPQVAIIAIGAAKVSYIIVLH